MKKLFILLMLLATPCYGTVTVIDELSIKNNATRTVVTASRASVDVSYFSKNLTASDTNVQLALNTLDQLTVGGGGGTTDITGKVPYTGATGNVVLGSYDISGASATYSTLNTDIATIGAGTGLLKVTSGLVSVASSGADYQAAGNYLTDGTKYVPYSGATDSVVLGNYDITSNASTSSIVYATNAIISSTLSAGPDTDTTHILGRVKIGYDGIDPDYAMFSHYDNASNANYALIQDTNGLTAVNAAVGQEVDLRLGNVTNGRLYRDGGGVITFGLKSIINEQQNWLFERSGGTGYDVFWYNYLPASSTDLRWYNTILGGDVFIISSAGNFDFKSGNLNTLGTSTASVVYATNAVIAADAKIAGYHLPTVIGATGQVPTLQTDGTSLWQTPPITPETDPIWSGQKDDYVPYTGATGSVALGNYNLTASTVTSNVVNVVGALGGSYNLPYTVGSTGQVITQQSNGTSLWQTPSAGGITSETDPIWTGVKSDYVPYTGATGSVVLGSNDFTASGKGSFGVNYLAVIGNDGALQAGHFADTTRTVDICNNANAIDSNGDIELNSFKITTTGIGAFGKVSIGGGSSNLFNIQDVNDSLSWDAFGVDSSIGAATTKTRAGFFQFSDGVNPSATSILSSSSYSAYLTRQTQSLYINDGTYVLKASGNVLVTGEATANTISVAAIGGTYRLPYSIGSLGQVPTLQTNGTMLFQTPAKETDPVWSGVKADYVPYSQATGNVVLGAYDLSSAAATCNTLTVNNGVTSPVIKVGTAYQFPTAAGATGQILTANTGITTVWQNPQTEHVFNFALAIGTPATTGANKTNLIMIPFNCTIQRAKAAAKTAPTGQGLIFDINYGATTGNLLTIWSTQANRLTIAASANSGTQSTFNTTSLSENSFLSIDTDQVGSVVAGQDITVELIVKH